MLPRETHKFNLILNYVLVFFMVDLPPELWLNITYYLTQDEVDSLMAVNRTLMNIALNARYHKSAISGVLRPQYSRRYREFIFLVSVQIVILTLG